jgi:hypothetical protein
LNSNHEFLGLTYPPIACVSIDPAFFVQSLVTFNLAKLSSTLTFRSLYLGVALLDLFSICNLLSVKVSYSSHGLFKEDLHRLKSFQVYLKVNTCSAAL